MALSTIIRSSARLPALMNATRISCMRAPQSQLLVAAKQSINTTRSITVSPIRKAAAGGNHSGVWLAEKALSLGLLGIIPVSIAFPSQAGDVLLALSVVMHAHWGLEAIVTDYVREILFGKYVPKAAHGMLIIFSAVTLAGLCLMVYNGDGIANTLRKIWAIKGKE